MRLAVGLGLGSRPSVSHLVGVRGRGRARDPNPAPTLALIIPLTAHMSSACVRACSPSHSAYASLVARPCLLRVRVRVRVKVRGSG